MTPSSLPAVGAIIAGKLQIVRSIGVGGMGVVYEVEHTLTKHRRALKLLHGEYATSPGVVTRFLREASAAGRIGNPHVVETFDAGTLETGEPYIVMELLQGRTLADDIERRGFLPVQEVCEILLQACDGVRAAHAAGIIHRDLKPENLFLQNGSEIFVKILDFGISKFDTELTGSLGLTQEGLALGTPFYMPPEQVRGQTDIGVEADVYSLGVILYECLTADKPFTAETLPHLAILINEGRYTLPSAINPNLSSECDAVVAKAMAPDRSQRYRTIDELVRALEGLRDSAGPPTSLRPSAARPQPAQAAEASTPAPDTRAPAGQTALPAHTSDGFGRTGPQAEARSGLRLGWVIGALLALAILGLGLRHLLVGDRHALSPEPEAGTSVVAPSTSRSDLQQSHAAKRSPPPDVSPALSASASPLDSAEPEATPPTARPMPADPAPPVRAPAASTPSKVRQLGLSEENPF